MPSEDPRAAVRAFQTHRRATHRRLRRVNEALSRWDEYEAAAEMPAEIRPAVEPPTLGRHALKELQHMFCEVIADQELMWERRQ